MQKALPWQQEEWQYLVARKKMGKLPHAILISGMKGVGKKNFAQNFAALLLCQNEEDEVCGSCSSCELLQADNHPDFIIVRPEDKAKAIKVDQVRELIADLNNTSHYGGYRVVIIESADLLNIAGSNSLLKTLEEPAENTIIILVSAHPANLPATIRSRCQNVLINPPKYFVAKEWLERELPGEDADLLLALCENAPFKALDLIKEEGFLKRKDFFDDLHDLYMQKTSSVKVAKKSLKLGLDDMLIILSNLVGDLVKIKFSANENIVNKDQVERLAKFASKTSLDKLFSYKEKLDALRHHLSRKININQQMAMENLMVSWIELFG